MMAKLYGPLLIGAAILIGVSAIFGAGYWKGSNDGQVSQLKSSIDAYRERGAIDARVRSSSDYQLCISLGGVPEQCEQLRGLDATTKGK